MKALRPIIASNGVPYIQMTPLGSHSTSGSEKEGKNEKIEKLLSYFLNNPSKLQ